MQAAVVLAINVKFTKSACVLLDCLHSCQCTAVSAAVYQLAEEDQAKHAPLVKEFINATHWPKHLLVHYSWHTQHEEDEEAGLLVLFSGWGRQRNKHQAYDAGRGGWQGLHRWLHLADAAAMALWCGSAGACNAVLPPCSVAAAALAAVLLGLNVMRTSQEKLRAFLADVAGDAVSMAHAPDKGD
jgi:hypothetical protein